MYGLAQLQRLVLESFFFFFLKVPCNTEEENHVAMNDEKPVGGGEEWDFLEVEEDFSNLSLEKLLVHTNWKARRDGYQKVKDSPQRNKVDFLMNIKKICTENIASNIEVLLDAFTSVTPYCTSDELELLCSGPLSLSIEKGLTGRPKAVSSAENFIILLVENKQDPFRTLLPAFSNRLLKSKIAALHMTTILVSDFGVSSFPVEKILKTLVPVFGDANPQVRKEGSLLACALYKFMGQSIKSHLAGIREGQLHELEKQFSEITAGSVPKRSINGVEPREVRKSCFITEEDMSGECDDERFRELEEDPVLSRLPKNFFVKALDKSLPWQDRCSLVNEHLIPLLLRPRLRRDNYHELGSFMREYLVDPQAPIMLLGFKMIQECARGLRADFSPHARSYLNPLFEKMKDKKTSVQEHVLLTLEKLILFHCISLDHCVDEVEKATMSKNPSQRLSSINFCKRIIEKIGPDDIGKLSTSYSILRRMVNDEKAENREAGYALVAKLACIFGDEMYEPVLDSMDEKHKVRYFAFLSQYRGECNPPKSLSDSPAKKITRFESGCTPVSETLHLDDSLLDYHQPNNTYSNKPLRNIANPDDGVSLAVTLPEKSVAVNTMVGLLNGDTGTLDLLRSKDWNKRLEGIEKIHGVCNMWTPSDCTKYLDTLVVCLRSFPGFKESIFQVHSAMRNLIKEVQARAAMVSLGTAYVLVTEYTPRLTEAKNRAAVRETCSAFADRFGPRFVFKHMIAIAIQIHTPKLLQEVNEYLAELISSFSNGMTSGSLVDIKETVEYIRSPCLDQLSPAVRLSSVNLLIAMFHYAGSCVDEFVHILPAPVQATFEQEKAKKGGASGSSHSLLSMTSTSLLGSSTKRLRSESNQGSTPSTSRLAQGQSCFSLFLPSDEIKAAIKQITSESDWKKRLDAVHRVESILSSLGDELLPPSISEQLFKALSTRFGESNRNFVVDVLRVIPILVEQSEQSVASVGLQRHILPPVFCMLGDQKASLREEARKVSNIGVRIIGLDGVLDSLKKPLNLDSNACRQNVLELMLAGFDALPSDTQLSKTRLGQLIPGVCNALMDRISEVRALAEQVTGCMIRHISGEPFFRHIYQLKTADQNTLIPIMERQFQITYNSGQETSLGSIPRGNSLPQQGSSTRTLDGNDRSNGFNKGTRPSARNRLGEGRGRGRQSSAELSDTQVYPRGSSNDRRRSKERKEVATPIAESPEESLLGTSSTSLRNYPSSISHQHLHKTRNEEDSTKQEEERIPKRRNLYQEKRKASPSPPQAPKYSLGDIIAGIRCADMKKSSEMVADVVLYLQMDEECGSSDIVLSLVERLIQSSGFAQEAELSLSISKCLSRIFASPKNSRRFQNAFLFQVLGKLFDCLLSDSFLRNQPLIKSLNTMVLNLLEECIPDEVFSALLSRLTSYSSTYLQTGKKEDLKYIQITVKCIMRSQSSKVTPENIILCCHEYLLQHPPSAFRSVDDLPIRTVKTILQTTTRQHEERLLQLAVDLIGSENLVTNFIRACLETKEKAEENERHAREESVQLLRVENSSLGSPQREGAAPVGVEASAGLSHSSLFSTPVREARTTGKNASPLGKWKSSGVGAATARTTVRSTHLDPERNLLPATSRIQPKASQITREELSSFSRPQRFASPVPVACLAPDTRSKPHMGSIFNKIRNFSTSAEGIDDLYNHFKENSTAQIKDFDFHFLRCSEPFQLYIKQKIAQKKNNDKSEIKVVLPPSLAEA